ncbi:class II fructose-bisphosphatase [Candidatus Roizmanbacteria bacterium]|nr:class II fructose-bisphosphatase [Candidatus Roizmanbacteria bacterium]
MYEERNLALEFVRVTEAAAIASAEWIGRGDKNAADQAAVDEMRSRFNQIHFKAEVVIGEGTKDEAPMLYTGEIVGKGADLEYDIAVDPLECTDSVAYGRYNAISVIVTGKKGSLFHAPDTYMEKIAVGPAGKDVIDLDAPTVDTIQKVAKAQGKDVREVTIIVLDRPRHTQLIEEIRQAGARVRLITDGDVAGGIAPCVVDSGVDLLMGIGASTEAVLASSAIKIFGGELLCRFKPKDKQAEEHIRKAGISDLSRIYRSSDLVKSDENTFTATGIIDGPLLSGVQFNKHTIVTHSLVMRGASKTIRYITTHHHYQP